MAILVIVNEKKSYTIRPCPDSRLSGQQNRKKLCCAESCINGSDINAEKQNFYDVQRDKLRQNADGWGLLSRTGNQNISRNHISFHPFGTIHFFLELAENSCIFSIVYSIIFYSQTSGLYYVRTKDSVEYSYYQYCINFGNHGS